MFAAGNCSKQQTCCPRSHVLRPKKYFSQCGGATNSCPGSQPKATCPSVPSVTQVANDKGDNEMILGPVHRSPGFCLIAEENPRKPQLGDHLIQGQCDQSSPQMGSLSSKGGRQDCTARQEGRRKELRKGRGGRINQCSLHSFPFRSILMNKDQFVFRDFTQHIVIEKSTKHCILKIKT